MKWIYNDNYKDDKIIFYKSKKSTQLTQSSIVNNAINMNNITEDDLNKKRYMEKYIQYKKK